MAAATHSLIVVGVILVLFHGFSAASAAGCADFIQQSCDSTLHPSLCAVALAKYTCEGGESRTRIAHYAANLSLTQVSNIARHVAVLNRTPKKYESRTAGALADCADTLSEAADLLRQAATELEVLSVGENPEAAWHVSNAQTWMSAALTNEDTCNDGLAHAGGAAGPSAIVRSEVTKQVGHAMQHTSIALALVNRLAA